MSKRITSEYIGHERAARIDLFNQSSHSIIGGLIAGTLQDGHLAIASFAVLAMK